MNHQSDTYERIIESAQELMHASSYSDVGVAAICEKANVKKGSFYHFFPSKQDLTLAVIDKNAANLKTRLIDKAFDSTLPPLDRLQRFMDLTIEMQTQIYQQTGHVYGCPFGNLATEMSTQDEDIRKKLEKSFSNLDALFRNSLQEAVENNELDKINDVDATAQAMLAYLEGAMMLAKTQNNPALLKQLLPAALQIRL